MIFFLFLFGIHKITSIQKDGRWYERTGSVVISEQKNKMEGRRDNIDAALVCEDRLREHTWTINGKFQGVDAARGFGIEILRAHVNHQLKDNLNVTLV